MEKREQGERTGDKEGWWYNGRSCGIFRTKKEWRMRRESQASEECRTSPMCVGGRGGRRHD